MGYLGPGWVREDPWGGRTQAQGHLQRDPS